MPEDVWTAEARRARLYRDQWDAKIAFRASQLRRFSGSVSAFNELWENWQSIDRKDNYISSFEDFPDIPGEAGSYLTPYDLDVKVEGAGSVSSSPVRLRGTRHAGDQSRE